MASDINAMRKHVGEGIPKKLPNHPGISKDVDHAPARRQVLSKKEKKLAIKLLASVRFSVGFGLHLPTQKPSCFSVLFYPSSSRNLLAILNRLLCYHWYSG